MKFFGATMTTTPEVVTPIPATNAEESTLIGNVIKNTSKKPSKTDAFVVITDPDIFKTRIQINSNIIKKTMMEFDSNLIRSSHIVPDSAADKDIMLIGCRYSIFDLINDGNENQWMEYKDKKAEWTKFIDEIKKYETDFIKVYAAANKDTKVPFHSLPYILKKGEEYSFLEDGTPVGFILKEASVVHSFFGTYLNISGSVIIHNGIELTSVEYSANVGAYSGEKTLSEVGITKLEDYPEERAILIERGKKYFRLHQNSSYYGQYEGPVVRKSWYKDNLFTSTGRIVIDRAGMMRSDPNYDYYFGGSQHSGRNKRLKETISEDTITESQYLVLSPYCYGFSLVAKQWGEFKIDNISEIKFRTDAYSKLVLNQETKDTMFSLAEYSGESKDIIDNKGGGCIFLLHGKPGVGKTLSAEAIAETLHRPLYMVSVGELGTNVETLDNNLRNILEIASSWNAILLIDEVDIFLEKRDLNIERNALVGVFLRLLEYYNGILFLTSNRAENLDPAFYSRISLAIKYPDLSEDARKQIWKGQTTLYGVMLKDSSLGKLAKFDINGRQIKNCIRLTVALAHKSKNPITVDSFLSVIRQTEEFNKLLTEK